VRSAACWLIILACGCSFKGAQSYYGQAEHDMNFGEMDFILVEREEGAIELIPFLVYGQGTLPDDYAAGGSRYQRTSIGHKVRLPVRFQDGKIIVYLEGGAMVSYYDAEEIGTPFEPEAVVGVGTQVRIGKGWSVDLAARVRRPLGNGDRHDEPEHAPHGNQAELVFGLKKDF
jgi:hypothetical protein